MHDGVQYDPIQGQGQGHEPLKVGNLTIFMIISSPIYYGAGKCPHIITLGHNTTIPKAYRGRMFDFCPSFCVT